MQCYLAHTLSGGNEAKTCSPELLHLKEADVKGADRREWRALQSCKMQEKYDFITAP